MKTTENLGFDIELFREFLSYVRGVLGRPLNHEMIRNLVEYMRALDL